MKLYGRAQNSAGERVRIALNLKGLDHEYVAVGKLPPGEYRRLNPQGHLPALEVDGRVVPQSGAILEYLEETYPERPLLPADPVWRAEARAFGAYIASEMHAVTVNRIRKFLTVEMHVGEADLARWMTHWLSIGFAALEATLAARETEWAYCFGDEPGWADLHLVPQLANGRRFSVELSPYPRLLSVEANCAPLDAFRRARPEAQIDFVAGRP
jgi:maleylacetoacetate isomerase/maleylpyruvate isomerase